MQRLATGSRKKTLAIDFDDVLRDPGDEAHVGALDAIPILYGNYTLICFTCRHDLEWVRGWLRDHGLEWRFKDVTNRKPRADYYIDDKNLRFTTWAQVFRDLQEAENAS